MSELKISPKTEAVTFSVRVDLSILQYYEKLAQRTNRSRNELLGLALDYAKDKFVIEPPET
ncbi:CopG family transcriptional regulator [Allofournierella sp.]|uniref:CopG family transcriptional regulator n=1 Tax=Allofournierella sp. TaxID=1940256 RepID=UPI003AB3C1BE